MVGFPQHTLPWYNSSQLNLLSSKGQLQQLIIMHLVSHNNNNNNNNNNSSQ